MFLMSCPVSLLSCVDNYVVFCLVSLLSCVDNYVVFVLCQCFMFLMSFCPVSLLSCVDNHVVFICVVSVFHVFNVSLSCVIVVLC